MDYSVKCLKNRLANARKESEKLNALRKGNPADFCVSLCAQSASNHVDVILKRLEQAQIEAKRGSKSGIKRAVAAPKKVKKVVHAVRQSRAVSPTKYINSDIIFDNVVQAMKGVFFVCNIDILRTKRG
ncbi:MAG: hypothetical protein LBU83_02305 [Bacteroidales bacterium]|nr:hypothetical protein [Bacteroidales bacterium]